jgi:hypothetical protein
MNYLFIKVSPLSKKILLAEYPSHEKTSTIKVGSHSLLYRQLMAALPPRAVKKDLLTQELCISIPSMLRDMRDSDIDMLGLMIHQEHRLACMRWIQATVYAGATASHGIRTFFEHYDLDDADLNYESVFRQWQRYVRASIDLIQRPKEQLLSKMQPKKKPVGEYCDLTFCRYIADILEHMYSYKGRTYTWNPKRVRNMELLVKLQAYGISRVEDETGYKRTVIYKMVQSARKYIADHGDVKAAWERYYFTTQDT